jgi:hypothetical protein
MIKLLVEYGADIDAKDMSNFNQTLHFLVNRTPLHIASKNN